MRQPKLTPVQVAEMRRLYRDGDANQAELAARFGVHISTVSRAVRGLIWGPLEAR